MRAIKNLHVLYSLGLILLILLTTEVKAQSAGTDEMAFLREADHEALQWGACPEFMPASCRIAVLQGNPKEADADIFFKLQGNTAVPNHWHHSAERMVLVSGKMEVQYQGQKPEVMNVGTYAYGPPEKVHEARCLSEEACVLFIAFDKPVDAFAAK